MRYNDYFYRTLYPLIAQTLGLSASDASAAIEQVRSYAQSKQLMLVLDNLEQLLEAASQLEQLLIACPGIKEVAIAIDQLKR